VANDSICVTAIQREHAKIHHATFKLSVVQHLDTPESQFAAMNSLEQEKKIHLLSAETTFNVEQQKPFGTCWKNE